MLRNNDWFHLKLLWAASLTIITVMWPRNPSILVQAFSNHPRQSNHLRLGKPAFLGLVKCHYRRRQSHQVSLAPRSDDTGGQSTIYNRGWMEYQNKHHATPVYHFPNLRILHPTKRWCQYRSATPLSSTAIFMSSMDDDGDDARNNNRHSQTKTVGLDTDTYSDDEENLTVAAKSIESEWNVAGLKKEVTRMALRCHKKISKATQRLQKAQEEVDRLVSSDDATMEELENCPSNIDELKSHVSDLQQRLRQLNQLEVLLSDVKGGKKGKSIVLPEEVASLAIKLQISDEEPQRPTRPPKKSKGPKNMMAFRLPYRRYYTVNKTEIRVGKQAEDNDELSLSPEHRDSADWWMHASGCPGSHVVIRCHDPQLNPEVEQDAAALAARQSKCVGNTIKVSLTRARDVKKPRGAKAGLVQLTGAVKTVVVDMKRAQERLDRLDKTALIN